MDLLVTLSSVLEVCDDPLDVLSCGSDEVDDGEAGFRTTRRLERVDDCSREGKGEVSDEVSRGVRATDEGGRMGG